MYWDPEITLKIFLNPPPPRPTQTFSPRISSLYNFPRCKMSMIITAPLQLVCEPLPVHCSIYFALLSSFITTLFTILYYLVGMASSLLRQAFKYRYTNSLYTLEALSNDADKCLFRKIYNEHHCIHDLLPPLCASISYLRPKGHSFELPRCALELHKKVFSFSMFV